MLRPPRINVNNLLQAYGQANMDNAMSSAPISDTVSGVLGRFAVNPQPTKPKGGKARVLPELTPDEAMHRVMQSKNHRHQLATKPPEEREHWADEFKRVWVGQLPYDLTEVDLSLLKAKKFKMDEAKVAEIMKKPADRDSGDFPIIAVNVMPKGGAPHIILDGNHRVEAYKRKGEKTMMAYVHRGLAPHIGTVGPKLAYQLMTHDDIQLAGSQNTMLAAPVGQPIPEQIIEDPGPAGQPQPTLADQAVDPSMVDPVTGQPVQPMSDEEQVLGGAVDPNAQPADPNAAPVDPQAQPAADPGAQPVDPNAQPAPEGQPVEGAPPAEGQQTDQDGKAAPQEGVIAPPGDEPGSSYGDEQMADPDNAEPGQPQEADSSPSVDEEQGGGVPGASPDGMPVEAPAQQLAMLPTPQGFPQAPPVPDPPDYQKSAALISAAMLDGISLDLTPREIEAAMRRRGRLALEKAAAARSRVKHEGRLVDMYFVHDKDHKSYGAGVRRMGFEQVDHTGEGLIYTKTPKTWRELVAENPGRYNKLRGMMENAGFDEQPAEKFAAQLNGKARGHLAYLEKTRGPEYAAAARAMLELNKRKLHTHKHLMKVNDTLGKAAMQKLAYDIFVPVDLNPVWGWTPSPLPEVAPGHTMTTLRALNEGDPMMLEFMQRVRSGQMSPYGMATMMSQLGAYQPRARTPVFSIHSPR